MERGFVVAAVCLVFGMSAPAAQAQSQEQTVSEQNQQTFDEWDSNRDSLLSLDEYMAYAMYDAGMNSAEAQGNFENMDGDSSGNLDFGEFNGGICCA